MFAMRASDWWVSVKQYKSAQKAPVTKVHTTWVWLGSPGQSNAQHAGENKGNAQRASTHYAHLPLLQRGK